jgi:hypothetical protein
MASKSDALANDLPTLEIFPDALSIVITSPATIFSFYIASIILAPKSYSVSISVVFKVIFPVLAPLVADFSNSTSTTSPSTNSASSLILTPIDLLKAYVNASVLLISRENISDPASIVNGV